ncbi:TBC1 domain family member 20 isoform X2 [Lethenteron reissneri]|uniref:TBC1 domain family member 20 isoform X2 n=1 Tax=Lethenteron reissneri TaxID=7753 RepID=UPI002AB7149A|nr:TBC1 domain family member 20 isoform X2 [Lethenteron reissneri]
MSTKQTKNGAARGLAPAVRTQDAESKRRRKLAEVRQALAREPVDVAALRRSAISEGGLLTNELRRDVWPKLLSIDAHALPLTPGKDLRENNKDYNQVLLDVRRSLRRFPAGMQDDQRAVLQEQLIDVILHVLRRNPQLHYYQGYHDIVVTFLLVVGDHMATAMVDKLSTHHLRDFMDPTMDSTKHILNYLMPILERVNPELHDFMQSAEVGTIFALSWLITWYGHVLSDFRHVVRLYDFFLACHPLMPIYFAAVIPQDLPYETLISRAGDLFVQFPPSELAKEASLQFHQSTAISTFKDFELASTQQRPDNVLRHRRAAASPAGGAEGGGVGPVAAVVQGPSRMLKLAVWGLTATLGAAAIAAMNTALEWAPEFVLRLFP